MWSARRRRIFRRRLLWSPWPPDPLAWRRPGGAVLVGLFILLVLLALLVAGRGARARPARAAPAEAVPGTCVDGVLPHGALSRVCVPPSGWNGELVVWGHGYVAFNEPIGFYNLELPNGGSLPDLVQSLGYAFATTSYRQNGLTVVEGIEDVRELVAAFPQVAGRSPLRTYMVGASEGGLISALLIERYSGLFSGGLAACGPVGDFRLHVDYIGDFRVLFDYFFPGVLPGSAISVPTTLVDGWDSTYRPAVLAAVAARPLAAQQLLKVSGAAIDPSDPSTVQTTVENVLWYAVFGTNDANAKLGGNPYGNRGRVYSGSLDDARLNLNVQRYTADAAALGNIPPYQTSGLVTKPLVLPHTTGDEQVPFTHELLYRAKVVTTGSAARVTQIPIAAYGHCNFTEAQLLGSFALLVKQVIGTEPVTITSRAGVADAVRQLRDARLG